MRYLSITPILMFHTVAMSFGPYSSLFHEQTFQVQMYQAEEDRDNHRSRVSGESSRELNRCRRINRSIRALSSSTSCDEQTRNKCMPASCCCALISTVHPHSVSAISSQLEKIEGSHIPEYTCFGIPCGLQDSRQTAPPPPASFLH